MDIPSERELLKQIFTRIPPVQKAIKGVGDDCAILPYNDIEYLLVSTDTLVENNHFSLQWLSPEQIGRKAVEVNVSDIAAMGGVPLYLTISLILPSHTTTEFINALYTGILTGCSVYSIELVGGNTTKGETLAIDLTIIGKVAQKEVRRRSDAKVGDLIMLSGPLGGSTAALDALKHNLPVGSADITPYQQPRCRLDFSVSYAQVCNALIDVSDGLASEINHICAESSVGAVIDKQKIPLAANTKPIAAALQKDPYSYALSGGEDYQLLLTVSPENAPKIPGIVIGKIVPAEQGVILSSVDGKMIPIKGGYDHFSS